MLTQEQKKTQKETKEKILLKLAINSELFTQKDIDILNGSYWIKKEQKREKVKENKVKELHEALKKPVTKFVETISKDPDVIIKPYFYIFSYTKKSDVGRDYYGNGVNDYYKVPFFDTEISYYDRPEIEINKNTSIKPLKLEYDVTKFNLTNNGNYFISEDLQIKYKDLGIKI